MKKIWLTVPHTEYEGDHLGEAFAFADEETARRYAATNATGRNSGVSVYELEVLDGMWPPLCVFDCDRYPNEDGSSDVFCNFREFLTEKSDQKRTGTFLAISHDEAVKAATKLFSDEKE